MRTEMALDAFFYIIFTTVLFYTCSAVTVTVDDLGDIIEGIETRMMCNVVRTRPGSTGDPLIIWNNITSGVDQIGSLQSGSKFINDAYIDRFYIDVNDGSLVISNTLRSDSGTYQCSVTIFDDIPGAGDDDVVLDVIYLETPSLYLDTPVKEGERVMLTCSVVANPAPVIIFKKEGTSVQSGGQSTYVIHSVDRNDEGNYECQATNGAGTKSTASQMLEVYSPTTTLTTTNLFTTQSPLPARTTTLTTTNLFRTQSPLPENNCDKGTGLNIGIFFIGMIVGGVLVGLAAFVKMKQIKLTDSRIKQKQQNVDKKKQETYMEYVTEPSSPTYQNLTKKRTEQESAYVNVKTAKNTKT